jgi:hypothetical protein
MPLRTLIGSLCLVFVCDQALAVSITNRDDKAYKLTVIEGDAKKEHSLTPSGSLSDVCPKGCVVRLGDSENDEYELEGTEVVSIEDGYLYYDGPDAGTETVPGSNTRPPSSEKSPPQVPTK